MTKLARSFSSKILEQKRIIPYTSLIVSSLKPVTPAQTTKPEVGLNPIETEFVRFFVQMATSLSLPKSVGEIFGFLFASSGPRPIDEVVSGLGISKGSASQGLRFLLKIGAIAIAYVPGDRRTFYDAEASMRKVFSEALRESVRPHLESNRNTIRNIECILQEQDKQDGSLEDHYEQRIASLRGWNDKALQLLPILTTLFTVRTPKSLFRAVLGEAETPPVDLADLEEPSD